MDMSIFEVLPDLSINGLWIGLAVFLIMQTAKYADFIKVMPGKDEDVQQVRFSLVTSMLLGFAWAAVFFDSVATGYTVSVVVGGLYQMLVGALTATLGYKVAFKPLMERLNLPESALRGKVSKVE